MDVLPLHQCLMALAMLPLLRYMRRAAWQCVGGRIQSARHRYLQCSVRTVQLRMNHAHNWT